MDNPTKYTSLDDPQFDQKIPLRQAYLIMFKFLKDVYSTTDFVVGSVLGELQLSTDNVSVDPTILDDFLEAYRNVISDPTIIESIKFTIGNDNESRID